MITYSNHVIYNCVRYYIWAYEDFSAIQKRRIEIDESLLLLVTAMARSGRCDACKVRKIKVNTPSNGVLLLSS